jgi:small conductance mechanosensitive channel
MDDILSGLKSFFSQATADTALKIIGSLALLFLGFFVIRRIMHIFERYAKRSRLDKGIISFLSSALSITLRFILIISVASALGVPSTSLIAILSSLGLAVGLALQGSLGNVAGGLMLLLFHPFRVGDYIKNDAVEGTVTSVNIMYTQLSTFDGKRVIVPNSTLSNGIVTNFSAEPMRRVDITFPLAYETDVNAARALMIQIATDHPLVLNDPAPDARMGGLDSGRLAFTMRAWCKTPDFWTVTFDLNEGLKQAFERSGIAVLPPQNQVVMSEGSTAGQDAARLP